MGVAALIISSSLVARSKSLASDDHRRGRLRQAEGHHL